MDKKTTTTETRNEKEALKFLYEKLTNNIIGTAIDIHKALGPGFTEKIYQRAFYSELKNRDINFEQEKRINIHYKNASLGYQIADFVIESKVLGTRRLESGLGVE